MCDLRLYAYIYLRVTTVRFHTFSAGRKLFVAGTRGKTVYHSFVSAANFSGLSLPGWRERERDKTRKSHFHVQNENYYESENFVEMSI